MTCITPPALSDEALSLALDGLADAKTQQHLDQCSGCAERLARMRHFESALQTRLRRFDCPSPQDLADFHIGMLEERDTEAVREHLVHCPRCQAEINMLRQFLDLPPETRPIPDNIIPLRAPRYVTRATRVETSGNLALKGLKGDPDEHSYDERSGSARIFLESKAVGSGILLTGQVIDSQVDWKGAVAEVKQSGSTQQVRLLDDMSEFSFELSSSAPLTLSITASSGITLVIENLTFQT
jgi:hypothetical protein